MITSLGLAVQSSNGESGGYVIENSVPTPIHAPALERMIAVLRKRAEQEKVSLPRDVAFYLAKNFRSSTTTSKNALLYLIAHASATGTAITLTYTRNVLRRFIAAQARDVFADSLPKIPPEQSGTVVANIRRQYRVWSDRGVAFWLQTRDGKHNCQVRNKLEVNMREHERGRLANWDAYERALERRAKMRNLG